MFTGIIEEQGEVLSLNWEKYILLLEIKISFLKDLKLGDSIAHNGACLSVDRLNPSKSSYLVKIIPETLKKTSLGKLKKKDKVNIERALCIGQRLDGHFVQGHVDAIIQLVSILQNQKGDYQINLQYEEKHNALLISQGSICLQGISLTISRIDRKKRIFSVHIIPHTLNLTNIKNWKEGSWINVEYDILGKYIQKY